MRQSPRNQSKPVTRQAKPRATRPPPTDGAPDTRQARPAAKDGQLPRTADIALRRNRPAASVEQRREVRQQVLQTGNVTRIPRSRIGIAIRVGNRLPRRLRLLNFTPAVIALIPAYATYRYLIIDDEICIVEPSTYEIVDVIPVSEVDDRFAGGPSGVIQLSSSQRSCLLSSLPRDRARVHVEFSPVLNSVIPQTVELVPLPRAAVRCATPLDGYRYVIVESQVVIVEPDARRVVLALHL